MKRKPEHDQYEIRKFKPWFFWRDCLFCRQEFIGETGWRFVLQRTGGHVMWTYSCAECSTTKQHLKDNILQFMGHRPKAPTAPPKVR